MIATPVDEYLAREMAFKHRIKETRAAIGYYKRRKGLARHKCRDKIKALNKMLGQLLLLMEMDCLPWEPGPTLEMDSLATSYLSRL